MKAIYRFFPVLALVLATHVAPQALEAQQPQEAAYASPMEDALMPVTSESEEAIQHFWAGVYELDNVYPLRAAQHARVALDLDPEFGLAWVIHGFAQPGLTQQERLDEIDAGITLIAKGGTTTEMLVALAYKEWVNGNTAVARDLFGAAKKLTPEHPHLAFRFALLTGIVDGGEEGVLALRQVTEAFPESAPAYNNLSYGEYLAGNQQAGFTAVRKYAELNEGHPNPQDSYAELLQWAGRLDAAGERYSQAAAFDPEFDQAYLGLAEISQLTGRPDEARAYIETAIEHAPSDQARINYTRALGNAFLMHGDWKAAMENFGNAATEAEAAGFNGIATVAYRQLALTDAMGDGSAFELHLAKAEEIQGDPNAATYAFAGLAYALSGNLERAREEAAKLKENAQGGFVNVSHGLNALLDLEEGNVESAMEELSKADPTVPMVRALLADSYGRMGEPLEAQHFKDEVVNDRTFNFFNPIYPIAYLRVEEL